MGREGRGKVKTIEVNGETIGVVGLRSLILVGRVGVGRRGATLHPNIYNIFFSGSMTLGS